MIIHFRIWSRKTARHKWRLCLETDNKERAVAFFGAELGRLKRWGKWPIAQVGIDTIDREPGGRIKQDADFALSQRAPMWKTARLG